jgi:hypothetical protein
LAVEIMAARVEGALEGAPQRKTLKLDLVVRGSTGPPAM